MSIKFAAETILTARDNTSGVFAAMSRNAKTAAGHVRGLTKAAANLKGLGSTMMAGVSAPLAAMGTNALRMATNFDAAMNTTQSKLLITASEMTPLRDMAKDLGSTTAFSATEAGQAMGFLAQAGYDTNKILKTTPKTLDLASAANLDLAQAADIASNVMGAFKLDQTKDITQFEKNYQRVADVLALTSAKSNTSVEELAESMKQAAPWAAAFGLQMEETASMIGLMANIGIKGGESGTAMKNMLANLAAPAGAGKKALEKLGIVQSDLFKKTEDGNLVFKGAVNMMQVMAKAGLTNADAIAVFGRETGHGIMGILESEEAMIKLTESLNTSGAASRMAKINMQGLPGVMASLKSAWEGANLALAESGGFHSIIDGLKGATTALQKFAKANPDMLASMVKWGSIAALVAPALMAVGGAIASVGIIAKTAAVGFTLMSASAAPLVIGLTAIAAVGYLIYKNWDVVARFGRGLWEGMGATTYAPT